MNQFLNRRCSADHRHGANNGVAAKATELYTVEMAEQIVRMFESLAAKGWPCDEVRLEGSSLPVIEEKADCQVILFGPLEGEGQVKRVSVPRSQNMATLVRQLRLDVNQVVWLHEDVWYGINEHVTALDMMDCEVDAGRVPIILQVRGSSGGEKADIQYGDDVLAGICDDAGGSGVQVSSSASSRQYDDFWRII